MKNPISSALSGASPPLLQDSLDTITQNTRALVQPERLAISERHIEELFATGIEACILRSGQTAPNFMLQDARTSKQVHSSDLLALGPVVIKFFRGRWCPYCITELETWRDLHAHIRDMGAFFIAISPQTQRHNDFTLQQHTLPFPILSDPDAAVAEQFGLAYSVPIEHREYYKRILINIPFVNFGKRDTIAPESSWRLPLPGLFVVDQSGAILFSEAHADFRVRPEPAEVIRLLGSI